MIYTIPLNAETSQETRCTLAGLPCRFWIRQLSTGLYLDLWVNNQRLLSGAICLDRVDIIRNPASPLSGTLMVVDQQGTQDPTYDGLGSRFLLQFAEASS